MTCNGTWQYYAAPRIAAGGPLSQDVMKCRLKRLSRSDYGAIAFTDVAVGTAPSRVPDGRVRLLQARRLTAAAESAMADLRGWAGRPTAGSRAGLARVGRQLAMRTTLLW